MRKNKLKGIIALCIMSLALVLMYLYLSYGQQAFSTTTVLVAAYDIELGTIIDADFHFIKKNIRNEDIIANSLLPSESSGLEGMAASQYIPKNAQISTKYFEQSGIVLTKENFVFKIPTTWIYAVPSSIRRGDRISIYEIDAKIEQQINLSSSETDINTIEGIPTYQGQADIFIGVQDPVLVTSVIYVKDSANREVVDVDSRLRMDASSQVASIEIVCSEADLLTLEKKIAEGKKLILVYR